ncbi:MAG: glycosyltransferase, partial [Comamonadaceae bacterium]
RRARNIAHIDEPLYIRATATQQPVGGFFSERALSEARSVLETDIRHENDGARARIATSAAGKKSLHALWPVPTDVPITLLILSGMHKRELPGKGVVTLATNFVRSIIEKSSAERYKIIVVDDGFVDDDLRELLAAHGHSTHTCPKSEPFSFARKANFASSLVSSGIVFLLNDDLEVISPDWIQELAGQAARPAVGAVGCRLLFGDGSLQHAGIGVGFHGSAGHMFHRAPADGLEYAGFASIDRNYSAVTGAVMAYRKEVFDQVGGFDEQFRTDYNDLDFCLKCVARGLRIVYTPSATLYHFHNSSLKREHDSSPELKAFLARWSQVVKRDPYFSKNFQTQSAEL